MQLNVSDMKSCRQCRFFLDLFDINVLCSSLFVESTAQQYKETRGTKAKNIWIIAEFGLLFYYLWACSVVITFLLYRYRAFYELTSRPTSRPVAITEVLDDRSYGDDHGYPRVAAWKGSEPHPRIQVHCILCMFLDNSITMQYKANFIISALL